VEPSCQHQVNDAADICAWVGNCGKVIGFLAVLGWYALGLCHRNATGMPQECHRNATGMPQECHRNAIGMPQECHRNATGNTPCSRVRSSSMVTSWWRRQAPCGACQQFHTVSNNFITCVSQPATPPLANATCRRSALCSAVHACMHASSTPPCPPLAAKERPVSSIQYRGGVRNRSREEVRAMTSSDQALAQVVGAR
jgi:hypothetical protein